MQWIVDSRNFTLPADTRTKMQEKLDKVTKLLPESVTHGTITIDHRPTVVNKDKAFAVNLDIQIGHSHIRAEEKAAQVVETFDLALDKLKRQVLKFKDKATQHKGAPKAGDAELPVALETLLARRKSFKVKPMFASDAIEEMEQLDHDFFVFLNRDTSKVAVVYRREDGEYGLLEPQE